MKKIKIIAGTLWALLCMILILVLFPGLNGFSDSAAKLPFMKINPNYSGGEVIRRITSVTCNVDIRKPVFDGLFGEKRSGFVQVDWRGTLPDEIVDTIDYDLDSIPDFRINILKSTMKTELKSFNGKVGKIIISTPTSYGWAARVEVKK